ncbi:MAG TPA: outer membrane beta-barrel protein [Chitinophagaceae bacterium]|nr:outer membrane beta-barrel protein [Chitinophagaceae bacterium]
MLRKKTVAALAAYALTLSFSLSLQAQDSTTKENPLTLSGSVDGYYRFNFDNTPNGGFGYNSFTSFTNSQNSFQLGMASLKAEYALGKAGAVVDLGFGKRAEEFTYADENTLLALKQAYVYWNASEKVKLSLGKWGTHIGYEVLDPQLNKNYSMSYMFSYGPFSHTGIKADFDLGSGNGLMVGVANPTDVTAPTWSSTKVLNAQYSHAGDKLSLYVNYSGWFGAKSTPEAVSVNQFAVTASAQVTDNFSIGYDGTVQLLKNEIKDGSDKWWGSALYFNYDPGEKVGLTLRTEYFSDEKDAVKVGANVFQSTLSLNYKVGNFTLIPEIRLDNASQPVFAKKDGITAKKNTATALLAAIFSF